MVKQYYKFLLYSLYLGAIVCAVYLVANYYYQKNDKSSLAPKYYDSTIVNQNTGYSSLTPGATPYEIPCLRIRSIGFRAQKDYLYFKFQLAGNLPDKREDFPTFADDKITSIFYSLTLDENYFDYQGNVNPGGPEAKLAINFYEAEKGVDEGKINLQGDLIKGGPGFDYFVVRFPYSQLLIHQNSEFIVFTAQGEAKSQKYSDVISANEFENSSLAATKSNKKEILLDWTLKDIVY